MPKASGLASKTIRAGIRELETDNPLPPERCRRPGGGRKKLTEQNPTLKDELLHLVAAASRGDPESPWQWTTKSTRTLSKELAQSNPPIGRTKVGERLRDVGYRLPANRKTTEGTDPPERAEQFQYSNKKAQAYTVAGDPIISVATQKKELVGNYKNNGKSWLPKKTPIEVNLPDCPDKQRGKAVPYGIYALASDHGYVNVGITPDPGELAVASLNRWWEQLGKERYPKSQRILITPAAGGSNGYRVKLWKKELQKLADETGLTITVCHFPPGTSKWNKIAHRLFSFISINWKGRPLTS